MQEAISKTKQCFFDALDVDQIGADAVDHVPSTRTRLAAER